MIRVGSFVRVVQTDARHTGALVGTYGKVLTIEATALEVRALRQDSSIGGHGWVPSDFVEECFEDWLEGADTAYEAMINGMLRHSKEVAARKEAALQRLAERLGVTVDEVKRGLQVYHEECPE